MISEKHNAIVLKTYLPAKNKLIVFDATLGKIVGIPNRMHISNGAYISYYPQSRQTMYFMHNIDILDLPLHLAKDDILFIHHILELCYFFLPLHLYAPKLFTILAFLYTVQNIFDYISTKKLFLFQIFSALGLYPEHPSFQTPYFHELTQVSIDRFAYKPLDLMIEQQLDTWLLQCIELHPCAHNFKTIHFLQTNRIS